MLDLVTVGHFVLDLIISPRIANPQVTLGGPPTFVSLAASKLGTSVGVVSKVGKDFPKHFSWLRESGVDISHVKVAKSASTTSFKLTYNRGRRRLQLRNKAPRIFPEEIPASLHARVIHVAPVVDELSVEILGKLRDRASLLSIDPQGLIREFDENGYMKPKRLDDVTFLQHCDIFKSSLGEIKTMTRCSKLEEAMKNISELGVRIVLVTMGAKGIKAHFGGESYHVSACRPEVLKDTTGAGDAFIGGFISEYIQNKDPVWCCCVGSAAASFVVEGVGPERFGEKSRVYARATKIYEKGLSHCERMH